MDVFIYIDDFDNNHHVSYIIIINEPVTHDNNIVFCGSYRAFHLNIKNKF